MSRFAPARITARTEAMYWTFSSTRGKSTCLTGRRDQNLKTFAKKTDTIPCVVSEIQYHRVQRSINVCRIPIEPLCFWLTVRRSI